MTQPIPLVTAASALPDPIPRQCIESKGTQNIGPKFQLSILDAGGLRVALPKTQTLFIFHDADPALCKGKFRKRQVGDSDACLKPEPTETQNSNPQLTESIALATPTAVAPSCSDGIQNGLETGVDCGGSCGICPTCFDGQQNQGETGIDCGGPCPSCGTCTDGVRNQSETDTDCGGLVCDQCGIEKICNGDLDFQPPPVCVPYYSGYYSAFPKDVYGDFYRRCQPPCTSLTCIPWNSCSTNFDCPIGSCHDGLCWSINGDYPTTS